MPQPVYSRLGDRRLGDTILTAACYHSSFLRTSRREKNWPRVPLSVSDCHRHALHHGALYNIAGPAIILVSMR